MPSPCKCKKAECEECPEWIFTFADLVMLMMGFFVILWVLKPAPSKQQGKDSQANEEWIKTVAAIREAFGYIPDPRSNDPVDMKMLMNKIQRLKLDGPGEGGKINHPKLAPDGHEDEVTSIRVGRYATEGGKLCFERGDATLSAAAQEALGAVADVVRGHRNLIVVKGHASLDDLIDSGADAKMDLSLRRAEAAAGFLRSKGVEPALIRVQGCSTFEPVVQRQYTPEAMQANRRVEVEATATLVEDLQDHHLNPAPPVSPSAPPVSPSAPPVSPSAPPVSPSAPPASPSAPPASGAPTSSTVQTPSTTPSSANP